MVSKAVPASEGIAPTLLETPWAPRPEDRLGFFGCSSNGGSIVRIGLLGHSRRKPPRHISIDCPACGQRHPVEPIWRRPTEADEGREPDLVVDLAAIDGADGADDDQPIEEAV
jgi:hypothetical protein